MEIVFAIILYLPLLAICRCQLPLLILLASSWYQKENVALQMNLQIKKRLINYHFNGFYKTNCYKTKFNFSQFFFSYSLLYDCVFAFLIKAFENLIRFHWQAFIVYKNGENLKILIEIFCQKLIVSNVILAFLNHLKPKLKFSSSANSGRHRAPPLIKISGSAPVLWSLTLYMPGL